MCRIQSLSSGPTWYMQKSCRFSYICSCHSPAATHRPSETSAPSLNMCISVSAEWPPPAEVAGGGFLESWAVCCSMPLLCRDSNRWSHFAKGRHCVACLPKTWAGYWLQFFLHLSLVWVCATCQYGWILKVHRKVLLTWAMCGRRPNNGTAGTPGSLILEFLFSNIQAALLLIVLEWQSPWLWFGV